MRAPTSRPARRALALYDDAPRGDRTHVRLRWWTCPIAEVERAVPRRGRVLEIGCGHGLVSAYLALCAPGRDVLGVDIDADKIDLARAAADHLVPGEGRVRFEVVDPDGLPAGPFDAVVIVDVLYLLGATGRAELLAAAVERLAPGGLLVLKETDRVPRWKGAITVGQELLATRVLRITEGDEVDFAPPSAFAAQLAAAGLDVEGRRVDHGYVHPHHLLVARRGREAT